MPVSTERVEQLLACPRCHAAPLIKGRQSDLGCPRCEFVARVRDGVLVMPGSDAADFDALHEVMEENNETDVIRQLMYERQARLIEDRLAAGIVAVDIGCGPKLAYCVPEDAILVGVEPSHASIRRNERPDLRICGGAAHMPLRDQSVDLIFCLYSVHHMVGDTIAETRANVRLAFAEFARVLKPDGRLMVFEVCPWPPFWLAQLAGWRLARRILGRHINFFFWSRRALRDLGASAFAGARFEQHVYRCSWLATFPPAFALQWLKVPRFLYPFTVTLNEWRL